VRVLTFRHVLHEHLGWIATALDESGVAYDYADLYASPEAASDVAQPDALIFMGGPMSANDDLPFIHREIELIRDAIARRQPVLGICLGAQLIAKALGCAVYPNAVKEIGWAPVIFTEAARRDPLFAGLSGPEIVFHWHAETFDLPQGSELLASSAQCRHQAFRFGDRIYALQFHLEVTPAMIAQWLREDESCGALREVHEPIDPHADAVHNEALARTVFGRWCDLVKAQRSVCGASS